MMAVCVAEVAVSVVPPEVELRDQIGIFNFHSSLFCGDVDLGCSARMSVAHFFIPRVERQENVFHAARVVLDHAPLN